MELQDFKKRFKLVTSIGEELHKHGAAAHSLEAALKNICDILGLEGQFFATPTVLMASCKQGQREKQSIIRVKPGAVDLEHMSQLQTLSDQIINNEIGIDESLKALDKIKNTPNLYPSFVEILSYVVISGAASIFFGAGLHEFVIASFLGALVGLVWFFSSDNNQHHQIFEFLAAFLVSSFSCLVYKFYPEFSIQITTLSSLIVLVPGLTLTIAMTELATENLSAGTARLMQAILTFFKLSFGLALGTKLISLLIAGIVVDHQVTNPLNHSYTWIALIAASIAFTILFKARIINYQWMLLAGLVGFYSTSFAAGIIGGDLGAFVGGFCVGVTANLFAHFTGRPALTITMPGLIFLVPGSIGFKGLSFLMAKNTLAGIDTTFEMFLVAIALVSGLLLANILIAPNVRAVS